MYMIYNKYIYQPATTEIFLRAGNCSKHFTYLIFPTTDEICIISHFVDK